MHGPWRPTTKRRGLESTVSTIFLSSWAPAGLQRLTTLKHWSIASADLKIQRRLCGTTFQRAWARINRRTMTSCRCARSGPSGTDRCFPRRSLASKALQPEENDMHPVNRSDVEDFLFNEADLLDQWRLPEWLTLFTED